MQKFIIPQILCAPSQGTVTGQDARHIYKVLRMNKGDFLEVSNGRGKDFSARIIFASPEKIELDIIKELNPATESFLDITLCSGMLKDNKMDFVIKHVTELGINRWVPFFCERSIPSPDEKRMEKRIKRWETIAKESLKQCQRSCLPRIQIPLAFEKLLDWPEPVDLKLAFWEKSTTPLETLKKNHSVKKIIIIIGPEGGFSKNEMTLAGEKGFLSFSLGPRILRAETASIASCTLIQHILGDI